MSGLCPFSRVVPNLTRFCIISNHRPRLIRNSLTALPKAWASPASATSFSSTTASKMASDKPTVNRALWLSSFLEPAPVIDLPIPEATAGSAVVQVLAAPIVPYTKAVHAGQVPLLNLTLPLVPSPNAVGRVHAVGPDAIRAKPGDLVYLDATIYGRDDNSVKTMAGHHGGNGPEGQKLMRGEWRDGSLQQYQKIPLENIYTLDEERLADLGYTPATLQSLAYYSVAGGAILEAANVQMGETIVVGPCAGSFGGLAVELALAVGANVIGVGPYEEELQHIEKILNNPRFKYIVMTGDNDVDTAAIIKATPKGLGADVVSDWSPGFLKEPPYAFATARTLKRHGRMILSGGAANDIRIPYPFMLLKEIEVKGKWMCSRKTIERLISMIEQGHLKIGEDGGSQIDIFTLDNHHEAIEHAAKNGGWRRYTVINPNP